MFGAPRHDDYAISTAIAPEPVFTVRTELTGTRPGFEPDRDLSQVTHGPDFARHRIRRAWEVGVIASLNPNREQG